MAAAHQTFLVKKYYNYIIFGIFMSFFGRKFCACVVILSCMPHFICFLLIKTCFCSSVLVWVNSERFGVSIFLIFFKSCFLCVLSPLNGNHAFALIAL